MAAVQNGPDVYVLPLTEVSLPMAKQPGRSGAWDPGARWWVSGVLGAQGLLCVPFCWDLGCCEQARGQPSALHVPCPGLLCQEAVTGSGAPLLSLGCLTQTPTWCQLAMQGHGLHCAQWAGPTHSGIKGSLGLPQWVACEWPFHSGPGGGGQGDRQAGSPSRGFLAVSPICPHPRVPHQAQAGLSSRGYKPMAQLGFEPHLPDARAAGTPSCV